MQPDLPQDLRGCPAACPHPPQRGQGKGGPVQREGHRDRGERTLSTQVTASSTSHPAARKKNTGNNSHKRWLRRVTSQMGTSWGRNTAGAVTGATRSEPPPAPPHGRALCRNEEEKPKEGRGAPRGREGTEEPPGARPEGQGGAVRARRSHLRGVGPVRALYLLSLIHI